MPERAPGSTTRSRQLTFEWEQIEAARYDPATIYRNPTRDQLTTLPEGQHFDRKSARISARALAETVCALSNGDARGGVIAVGLKDRQFEGFESVGERALNDLVHAPQTFCPSANVKSRTVKIDGKTVLLFQVEFHPYRVVELTDGSVLRRIGDRDHRLRPEEVLFLKHDKGEVPFELEPCGTLTGADLDPELVAEFATRVRRSDGLEYSDDDYDVLAHRRLGKQHGLAFVPNNAGVLLFARDPLLVFPGCRIRFIRYEGIAERTGAELNVVKDISIEGPVPLLIDKSVSVLKEQLREYQALQPDGKFALFPEYPHDCIYEAIVNACCHRQYAYRTANVFIRMFDDRVEVESPGGFVPPVTAENIYDQHVPRNPILMDALRYFRVVRCANEGTRRMKHLMTESGLRPPTFRQLADHVSKVVVTLHNGIEHRRRWIDKDLSSLVGAKLASSLSVEEIRVLNYLAEEKRITVSDVYRITTLKTWHSARKVLDGLLKRELVVEVKEKPRDPKAHFMLAKPIRAILDAG
jgi:ATP-dependent DNA helicase RecG